MNKFEDDRRKLFKEKEEEKIETTQNVLRKSLQNIQSIDSFQSDFIHESPLNKIKKGERNLSTEPRDEVGKFSR